MNSSLRDLINKCDKVIIPDFGSNKANLVYVGPIVREVTSDRNFDSFMFEASDPPVFKWYLKQFGSEVNLFIDHSQIVEFTAWKTQLWGDRDIWKDKTLSYKKGIVKRP